MEEPLQPESLSSCRNVSDVVRNKVELCIQNYMSLDVIVRYLEKTHHISKSVTRIVWEQLREENRLFFSYFEMRCQMALQMRMFNDMLTKQAVGMFENELLDISDASPSVRALLRREQPERVHLLETLASKTKLSSAGLEAMMPYANGQSVVQTQIPYNQQDQVLNPASFSMPNLNGPLAAQWQIPNEQLLNQHLYASSFALSNANGISVTQLPVPNNKQNQPHQDPLPTYNDLIAPTFEPADTYDWCLLIDSAAFEDLGTLPPFPPADTTIQWPSPDDLPYTAATNPEEDLSTFDLEGVIGHIGPSFLDADTILASMDFNEQQQHQPHWQQQQQQQNVQVQGSNGLLNVESNGKHHQCLDQQQAGGGVQRHYPESEALNNPDPGVIGHNVPRDSYNKSAAQLVTQPSEQPQHQN
ncbi:uncharacterized protein LOC108852306 isoform X2 [Raphanus sativus]|uniref:Uncharacterized protein LOC108852306 isoform X2 n=1 Tax=Raphanus sativus TaxID=3726 RepID=A0A9W3DGG0_RAPSA|nr:uncharacterized protein LOC108852306 isoform X2 [Raphanus sativus]